MEIDLDFVIEKNLAYLKFNYKCSIKRSAPLEKEERNYLLWQVLVFQLPPILQESNQKNKILFFNYGKTDNEHESNCLSQTQYRFIIPGQSGGQKELPFNRASSFISLDPNESMGLQKLHERIPDETFPNPRPSSKRNF